MLSKEKEKIMKKGNKVFIIGSWDDKGAFYIQEATVQSWGKKRATMMFEESGEMAKHFFYVNCLNKIDANVYTHIISAEEFDSIKATEFALDLAKKYIELQIARCKLYIENYKNDEGYVKLRTETLNYFEQATPTVVWNPYNH